MQARELGALLLLAALWGSSFLIKVAVLALAPFVLMELRVELSALALAPLCFAVSRLPAPRARWKEFLTLGLLNAATPCHGAEDLTSAQASPLASRQGFL